MAATVFLDIDGTIWDGRRRIPDSAAEAIRKLRRSGHSAVLCSGRGRASIQAPHLLSLGFDGILAACGNHIEKDGRILYERLLPPELVTRSVDTLRENRMPLVLEGPEFYWFEPADFPADPYPRELWEQLGPRAKHLSELGSGARVNKFSADYEDGGCFDRVKEALGEELDFIDHNGRVVEFIPKGSSKGDGIARYLALTGADPEAVYAIGDGINDLDMIGSVRHGIAMGGCCAELAERAEYVTDRLWEDGLAHALAHYGLI
ncbi:MAG: HAD hydrolase family protein [Lachnospiraceae bacterium]|nr:HAD hydrolase family protein [Lachnospiraceae bacterium]